VSGHNSEEIVIRTERLRLRPVRETDLDAIARLCSDDRVMAAFGGPLTWERAVNG
jgi:RimJ/RimL family protein N-acetyltransferase